PSVRLLQPGTLTARVDGSAADPVFIGSASVPSAAVSDIRLDGVSADWRYFGRRLEIVKATGHGVGGSLTTSGWADFSTRPAQIYFTGSAANLSLMALQPRVKEPVVGRLN